MQDADPQGPRAELRGSRRADVVVVGGGFTGLWTAYHLLRLEPSARIVVLEQERVGFGASGRNGSWCVPELNAGPALLARKFGTERTAALHQAMRTTVDEIGRICSEEGIEGYEKAGVLLVARGQGQLPALEAAQREWELVGLRSPYELLSAAETRERLAVRQAEAALFSPDGASVHPGKLVTGVAAAVERLGGEIYEGSGVRGIDSGTPVTVRTPHGEVVADIAVLALEAYLTKLPGWHRALLPVYSLIELTEPLSEAQLATINWRARMCVSSMRLTVDYLALTPDRRILVGGRGAPYRYGSALSTALENHRATHQGLQAMFRQWFPDLSNVRFTHSWGGVLGMPRDWVPQVRLDHGQGLAVAYGYTGHGVATTHLLGRTLAELIAERPSERTELPLVGHESPRWEPEPLRWLAVRYVQQHLAGLDSRAARGGRPPTGRTIAERLAAH
jgi:glycine/D-amino acid oxidase-like deaminating enzyme